MKRAVGSGQSETVVCKSKFLAENFLIDDPTQVKEIIRRQKERYPDATHVCHAFLCGPRREFAGCSDDHEPSGTAGRPMLEVLKGSGLTDILVTVVRWFGGTKLGTGGLVRAYSDAVKELCLQLLLQKPDLDRNGGLGIAQGQSRLCEALILGCVNEGVDLSQFHRLPLLLAL